MNDVKVTADVRKKKYKIMRSRFRRNLNFGHFTLFSVKIFIRLNMARKSVESHLFGKIKKNPSALVTSRFSFGI